MKALLAKFGWLRVAAVVVLLLPLAVLPVLGVVWLWQSSARLGWLAALLAAALVAYLLQRLASAREARALAAAATQPGDTWPAEAEACWVKVEALAAGASIEEWPLNEPGALGRLARKVLALVAGHFHPRASEPLLEMTVPHTLAVIERAARELRVAVTDNIPLSHRVTLGAMAQANTLREAYEQNKDLLRVIKAIVAPQSLLTGAVTDAVLGRVFAHGSHHVKTWLLQEYIRKLGYHAIELYGGLLRLDESTPLEALAESTRRDAADAEAQRALEAEPLRILVLGRANAGKSSLINALFGELRAATDLLPDTTTALTPYRLEREGALHALVFDSPGLDGAAADRKLAERAVMQADLVLWVTAVDRPDRAAERAWLDRLREQLAAPLLRRPPLLVVATHIDRLRPVGEWQPPYVLDPPQGAKAGQIAAATQAVADDLAVELERVVPVCLAEGRTWNVDDMLWAAILHERAGADQVRLLRCMRARRAEENWSLLWRQLRNAGRMAGSALGVRH